MPPQSGQKGSQTLSFPCLLGIGWVAGTGDNRLPSRHRIQTQSSYCFKRRFRPSFFLPKPGFVSMESLEGTEDTPRRPRGVVGGGDIRPSLCPKELEAYPSFSSFLGLSTCTISTCGAADQDASKSLGWNTRICGSVCGLGKNKVFLSV